MSLPLPANLPFAYSLPPDCEVNITVLTGGPVDYAGPSAGPMGEVEGTIAQGETVTLSHPGTLRAQADANVDLVYPPSESQAAMPEQEPA